MHQPASSVRRTSTDGDDPLETAPIGDVCSALEDEDCRAMMQAAAEEPRSATEFADACDLPLSTTYRKVDKLTEAGLFAERLRLSQSGKHTSEYTLQVADIHVTLSGEGLEVRASSPGGQEGPGQELFAGAD